MTSRIITTPYELSQLIKLIGAQPMPFSISIVKGKKRSPAQNRLQRQWIGEITDQLEGQTAEEWRAYCKLHFGVPILRAENDKFREAYDRLIRPLPYEQKLGFMMTPIDFQVTRLMTTKQKTNYLEQVCQHFAEQGVVLTDPSMIGM